MLEALVKKSVQIVPWHLRTVIKRIPLVAGLQRKLLAHTLEGREFIHTIDAGPARGLIYPVLLPEDKGVWTGTYELDFMERLAAAVKPGSVCFDVGGWHGYCAGVMACRGAAKTVVFEPLPAKAVRIQKLMELNPKLSLTLKPAAVGEENGLASFQGMPETSMCKLTSSPFQQAKAPDEQITVEVVTLDSYCEANSIDSVDVIKLDVEGAEMLALRGAELLLRRCRPDLFVEAHSRELAAEVTCFLGPIGYEVTTLETGLAPDGESEPEVCHLRVIAV